MKKLHDIYGSVFYMCVINLNESTLVYFVGILIYLHTYKDEKKRVWNCFNIECETNLNV